MMTRVYFFSNQTQWTLEWTDQVSYGPGATSAWIEISLWLTLINLLKPGKKKKIEKNG